METEIYHNMSSNMSSKRWRPRKTSGIIQSESGGLRTREAGGVSSRIKKPKNWELQCPEAGAGGCPSSKKKIAPPLPFFLSFWALNRLDDACPDW